MELVAGVDSSTQSTKVELRERNSGQLLASATAAHDHACWDPPVSEQLPLTWWQALTACFAQFSDEIKAQVVAISVAAQQHGLVLLDQYDAVLRPVKLWNDTTSASQAAALVERLSPQRWAERCGSVPLASFTISKLAWVLENEPHSADRIARIMLPHDWLTWRLSDRHVTDRGDASGTGWFDPARNEWAFDLLSLAVSADYDSAFVRDVAAASVGDASGDQNARDLAAWAQRLPQVLQPDEAAGTLTPSAAAELGLSDSVLVGPGTGDNMAAALGLGLKPGDMVISLGTSGTAYCVSRTPTCDPSGAVAGFADASGGFLPLVCTLNATRVTDTVARWLGVSPEEFADLALAASNSADAPVLVPYFDGERTPDLPDASGHLFGLRNDTTRQQLALAAHDGVLCGLLDGIDALSNAGVKTNGNLYLIGGGARSVAYQRRAAVLHGQAIIVPDHDETVALGAAVQAAAISGEQSLIETAAAWKLGEGRWIEPPQRSEGAKVRQRYAECRNSIVSIDSIESTASMAAAAQTS